VNHRDPVTTSHLAGGDSGPVAKDRTAARGRRCAFTCQLRRAGLSWRKISTLRDLAERMTDGRLNHEVLSALPDDELMTELTAIPGIGPWTVQGALIIALRREDVVLPGDLALRKAIQAAYELDHLPTQQEVLAIAEKWRPYRSLATSYLFSAAFEPEQASPATRLGSA
jgi:DNA-3-methyladenine glycosylase II